MNKEEQIINITNKPFHYIWFRNFKISTSYNNNMFVIKANKEGLESLGRQLIQLSQDEIPVGFHLHYDEYNCLEDDSISLVIEKG